MNVEIVFSDVDGTLLNNEHKMPEGTRYNKGKCCFGTM